mmetsp:Transcript_37911/g.90036  ORF Transcript_37911/g.90036 Transcript_37911/m.90036 type:complete len:278 (-) Transcript_37911:1483-2316(-)
MGSVLTLHPQGSDAIFRSGSSATICTHCCVPRHKCRGIGLLALIEIVCLHNGFRDVLLARLQDPFYVRADIDQPPIPDDGLRQLPEEPVGALRRRRCAALEVLHAADVAGGCGAAAAERRRAARVGGARAGPLRQHLARALERPEAFRAELAGPVDQLQRDSVRELVLEHRGEVAVHDVSDDGLAALLLEPPELVAVELDAVGKDGDGDRFRRPKPCLALMTADDVAAAVACDVVQVCDGALELLHVDRKYGLRRCLARCPRVGPLLVRDRQRRRRH